MQEIQDFLFGFVGLVRITITFRSIAIFVKVLSSYLRQALTLNKITKTQADKKNQEIQN